MCSVDTFSGTCQCEGVERAADGSRATLEAEENVKHIGPMGRKGALACGVELGW